MQDVAALVGGRQVDEEEFVEPPAPQELRGEHGDVVRRRDDKDRLAALLQPEEELPDHARGDAAVVRAARAREPLFDLVDPEDARRDVFRCLERALQLLLGLPDVAALHGRKVEAVEREFPAGGDRLGREGLAAAGHADEQDAARGLESLFPQQAAFLRGKEEAFLVEPVPQSREAAHVADALVDGDLLQSRDVGKEAILRRAHLVHVLPADGFFRDERRHDVLRLDGGDAAEDGCRLADVGVRPLDCDLAAIVVDVAAHDLLHLVLVGQRELEPQPEALEAVPDGGGGEHDDLPARLVREGHEVEELARVVRVGREVGRLGQDEGRVRAVLHLLADEVERAVDGLVVAEHLVRGEVVDALGQGMDAKGQGELLRDLFEQCQRAGALDGVERDKGDPCDAVAREQLLARLSCGHENASVSSTFTLWLRTSALMRPVRSVFAEASRDSCVRSAAVCTAAMVSLRVSAGRAGRSAAA